MWTLLKLHNNPHESCSDHIRFVTSYAVAIIVTVAINEEKQTAGCSTLNNLWCGLKASGVEISRFNIHLRYHV